MSDLLNNILMVVVLVALYMCVQKYKNKCREDFMMDKIYYNPFPEIKKIEFNYEDNPLLKDYASEQKYGVNASILYGNEWIEKIEDGQPVYNNRAKYTGNSDTLIDTKAIYNNNFYDTPVKYIDGTMNPDNINNSTGKTIHEVYDDYFVDFKDLTPENKMTLNEVSRPASSDLNYMMDDTWTYVNEKPENGGVQKDGLYAYDMHSNMPAVF